jgi:mRNA-decapping enzyme subunit 2
MQEARFFRIFFDFNPHLLRGRSYTDFKRAYERYRGDITVCGAILLNAAMDKVVLVSSYNERALSGHNNRFKFPRGKIDEGEPPISCAAREVWEEVGYPIDDKINEADVIRHRDHLILYIVKDVPEDYKFCTQTIREIGAIEWFRISEIRGHGVRSNRFPDVYQIIE